MVGGSTRPTNRVVYLTTFHACDVRDRAADLPLAPPMASGTWAILKVLSCLRPVGILSSSPNTSSISKGRKLAYLHPSVVDVLAKKETEKQTSPERAERELPMCKRVAGVKHQKKNRDSFGTGSEDVASDRTARNFMA